MGSTPDGRRRSAIGPEVRGAPECSVVFGTLPGCLTFRKAGHEGTWSIGAWAWPKRLADPDARLGDTAMDERLKALDQHTWRYRSVYNSAWR